MRLRWTVVSAFLLLSACAHRALAPVTPEPLGLAPALAGHDLRIRTFTVEGLGPRDSRAQLWELRESLADHIYAVAAFDEVSASLLGERLIGPGSLLIDVELRLERSTYRTVLLDLLTAPAANLFAPCWGEVRGQLHIEVSTPAGERLAVIEREAQAPFSALFFSWWRSAYVERAYTEVYRALFVEAANAVATVAQRAAGREPVIDVATLVPAETERAVREPSPDYFQVVTSPPPIDASTLAGALKVLGGIEAGTFYGFARVASQAKDESGNAVDIAAGKATQTGYRIALYSAPKSTGFFVSPLLGFMAQTISIADFRATLPKVAVAGGHDIEARCSLPATGEAIDCGAPNTYELKMQSGFGGVRAGYDFVEGNSYVQLFGSASLGINLVEYRQIEARVADYRATGTRFEAVKSGAAGATLGLRLPRAHVALRFIGDYELYRSFSYAEPLEFKGFVSYNKDKQVFERPRTWVKGAGLTAWSLQCALAFTF
jgi:hypothetical protein